MPGLTLARDKALTKKILAYHRLPVARFAAFKHCKKVVISSRLEFPMLVKSLTDEGSESISQASLVSDHEKLIEPIASCRAGGGVHRGSGVLNRRQRKRALDSISAVRVDHE